MTLHCISANHAQVKQLSIELALHPIAVASKIAVWQETNGMFDRFPTLSELQAKPRIQESGSVAENRSQMKLNDSTTSLYSEVLNNFENYFPDYSFYNDEQRRIVAQSVSNGDITIQCTI